MWVTGTEGNESAGRLAHNEHRLCMPRQRRTGTLGGALGDRLSSSRSSPIGFIRLMGLYRGRHLIYVDSFSVPRIQPYELTL